MCERWHVVKTLPRSEALAADELNRQGLQTFSPRVNRARFVTGDVDNMRPLSIFPGYLFVRCDLDGNNPPNLNQARHAIGWVHFDGTVPFVPDEVVITIAQRVAEHNNGGESWIRFETGQQVRVVSAVMDTIAEVVEGVGSATGHAKVLLEFMGRLVSAKVPWQDLQPLESDNTVQRRVPRRTRGRRRWVGGFGPAESMAS